MIKFKDSIKSDRYALSPLYFALSRKLAIPIDFGTLLINIHFTKFFEKYVELTNLIGLS